MIKNCSLKKFISKLLFQNNISILLSQKNVFQKNIPKLTPSKNVFRKHMSNRPLKIATSKNAFLNCYKLSIGNKYLNPLGLKTLDM